MMESTSETNQLLPHSSSSSLPRCHYDVFLSFRGEDTRKSFTDHLFAALCRVGVYTFRDAEELRKGEDISTDLTKAIRESRISIIVFSKTYASSWWCLEEVVKIVECKEKVNQAVFPVFYDVDPSEVRKQTGKFGDALALHQQRFGAKKVSQWKAALTKVANFSGWDLQNDAEGYESNLIDKIVQKVLQVVNHTYLNVARYPVGVHTRVREILSLLQSEANNGVRMIGIYGMGGVGKTTLAKAVFNQIYGAFEGSCFLDVRSECSKEGSASLNHLQKQLLCKTLKTTRFEVDHVDEGISLIKLRLGLKKLLIVVDDVDHESQLDALVGERDWFGPGSTIIITTRNVGLLNGLEKDCEKYNVVVLSSKESLELFSWHAFKNPYPLEAFLELSTMIVSYTRGLPLALTVLGSHFWTRSSIQQWRDDFEKLRRIPHKDILKILKISYDALDNDVQRIFLDIACFFVGEYNFCKEEILKILNGCGFFAQSGITTLIDRCLLQEGLYMHGLVRDMGREIVREESLMQPEKRSRLFLSDEVLDVLVSNKGTEAIETMIIDLPENVNLSTKVFSKMTRLRVLKILSMNIKGPLKYLSNELRLLYWKNCPLRRISADLCLKKLVILKMEDSNIEEFRPNLQHFRCLEILRLNNCMQLKRAPNFAGAHSLKTLSLYRCSNLVELSQSIGDLENLVELDMGWCKNLRALPSSICKLKSLEILNLERCSKIKELPTNLGKLEQLCELNAIETSVSHVPSSCGSLRYLNYLILGPGHSSWCCWERLEYLTSSNANLCSLYTLQAPYHYVQHLELQISHGSLSLLRELNLSHSYFNTLPFSLSHLSRLLILNLNNCQNLRVIQDLPPSLCYLSAKNCPMLENIQDLSGLLGLRGLVLPNCSNLIELPGVENLIYLQGVDIRNCSTLASNSWSVNFFKAHFQNPNLQLFQMWVSKDMDPEYLCSNEVVGSPSNYTLPLFLKKKRIFILVMISCLFDYECYLEHKIIGIELMSDKVSPIDNNDMGWEYRLLYDHFTEPNKVEELEVLIEFYSLEQGEEENFTIHTCIVHEEEGEVYFIPMNPNKVIKFHPKSPYGKKAVEVTITHSQLSTPLN